MKKGRSLLYGHNRKIQPEIFILYPDITGQSAQPMKIFSNVHPDQTDQDGAKSCHN